MPRKVNLPGASELFRTTQSAGEQQNTRSKAAAIEETKPSGRIRHDEKITVYISRNELIALEQARLTLRGDYGIHLDRGRLVREAIAVVLEDLATRGTDSDIVRRLSDL